MLRGNKMSTNALFTVVCNHLKPTQILPVLRAGEISEGPGG